MNILAIGDVVNPVAVEYLQNNLMRVRTENNVALTIVNGENASKANGLDARDARDLLDAGADVITGGNHSLRKYSLHALMNEDDRILRPANFSPLAPGSGYTIVKAAGYSFLIINLSGRVYMDGADDPFACADRILSRCEGQYDFSIIDFHAEATSEKAALARYLDGRVSAVFGTHTHVTTADEQVLPCGTGFITDLGFTGVHDSILGVRSDIIIKRMRTGLPDQFEGAQGEVKAYGAIFELDEATGQTKSVRRIVF